MQIEAERDTAKNASKFHFELAQKLNKPYNTCISVINTHRLEKKHNIEN